MAEEPIFRSRRFAMRKNQENTVFNKINNAANLDKDKDVDVADMIHQSGRLEKLNLQANLKHDQVSVLDQSVEMIIRKVHTCIFDIIDDLIDLTSLADLPEVFLQEDRLFYIGIYFILIYIIYSVVVPTKLK